MSESDSDEFSYEFQECPVSKQYESVQETASATCSTVSIAPQKISARKDNKNDDNMGDDVDDASDDSDNDMVLLPTSVCFNQNFISRLN